MQFLRIDPSIRLDELSEIVGERNLQYLLNANQLPWVPNIGQKFADVCKSAAANLSHKVDRTRKAAILNSFVSDYDVFETAALLNESGWRILSQINTFENMLKVPDSIELPNTVSTLGSSSNVDSQIYNTAMAQLESYGIIDPSIFNSYSITKPHTGISNTYTDSQQVADIFQNFSIPWGNVTLYSYIDNTKIDFPVYPEEISDSRKANYTTMPDLLYQYEPWQLYQSSGPRSNVYVFSFHRDMWTGDHRDGKANELIRFCEACCYPEYNGSAVNTATVTLLIAGNPHITGVITDVSTKWDGPIGLDGWYLHCELSVTITEVSTQPLSYSSVKQMPLIG